MLPRALITHSFCPVPLLSPAVPGTLLRSPGCSQALLRYQSFTVPSITEDKTKPRSTIYTQSKSEGTELGRPAQALTLRAPSRLCTGDGGGAALAGGRAAASPPACPQGWDGATCTERAPRSQQGPGTHTVLLCCTRGIGLCLRFLVPGTKGGKTQVQQHNVPPPGTQLILGNGRDCKPQPPFHTQNLCLLWWKSWCYQLTAPAVRAKEQSRSSTSESCRSLADSLLCMHTSV